MTFWMGFVVGTGLGMIVLSIFYLWIIGKLVKQRDATNNSFLDVQKLNGDHLAEIARAIDRAAKSA